MSLLSLQPSSSKRSGGAVFFIAQDRMEFAMVVDPDNCDIEAPRNKVEIAATFFDESRPA